MKIRHRLPLIFDNGILRVERERDHFMFAQLGNPYSVIVSADDAWTIGVRLLQSIDPTITIS